MHLLTADPESDLGIAENVELDTALDTLARIQLGDDGGFRAVTHAATTLAAQGGLVVAILGGLDDDAARATASLRQPGSTGAAFVIDRAAFEWGRTGTEEPTAEQTTHSMLVGSGWSSLLVGPQITQPEAWTAVTTHGPVGARR